MKLKLLKKQLLVLTVVLLLQNTSGFLGTLTAVLNGAGMVVDFIKTLPSAAESVRVLVSSFTSGKSHGDRALDSVPTHRNETIEKYHEEFLKKFEEIDLKIDNLKLFVSGQFQHIEELIRNLPQEIELRSKREFMGKFIANINDRWDRFMLFLDTGTTEEVYSYLTTDNLHYIGDNLINFRAAITPPSALSNTHAGLLKNIATLQKDTRQIQCNGETSHHNIIHLFQIIVSTEVKAFILQALAYIEAFPKNNGWKQMLDRSQEELQKQIKEYIQELKSALEVEKMPYIRACEQKELHHHEAVLSESVGVFRMLYIENCSYVDTYHPSTLKCDSLESCQVSHDDTPNAWMVCFKGKAKLQMKASTCLCQNYAKFILTLMQSRVRDNYIVAAVRFQKIQNYIYIQIAEGKLEANAFISKFSWIEPTVKRNGEDPFEASLTVNEAKTMVLGDIQLPSGYILTGIKLSPHLISGEKGIRVKLYGVKFDYETGKLDLADETFATAPDLPGHGLQSSDMTAHQDSSQYTLAEFRSSNYKHSNSPRKLPVLNAAIVLPHPLSPIGGIGVFYENDTARLSLQLFTINYDNFMNSIDQFKFNSLQHELPSSAGGITKEEIDTIEWCDL